MTTAAETHDPVETTEQELPTAEEMRQARRRGLIEGILQRNNLDTFNDDPIADTSEEVTALVVASGDEVHERAIALVSALTTDMVRVDAVAGDLVRELCAFEDDLRALAGGEAAPEVRDEIAASAVDTLAGPPDPEAAFDGAAAAVDEAEAIADAAAVDAAIETIGSDDPANAPATESHELPVHRVTCMVKGCKAGALYRPTTSGNGFMVLERYGMDLEVALGGGPNGRPVCPTVGHGEMTLADEQLPAPEAIAAVAAKVEQLKGSPRLPYPAPAFNFENAFTHIIEKRHEVKADEEKWEDLKERTKKAKERLDDGNEQLGKMIDDYEDRIRERQFEIERRARQADEGHPEGTTLVRCTWEQQHPADPCPLCVKGLSIGERENIVRILGAELLPRDAQGHVEQVIAYRHNVDVESTEDALDGFVFAIQPATISEWTIADRAAVRAWVADPSLPQPKVLGRPHVAAAVTEGAKVQACVDCGGVLKQLDSITEAYPTSALVRTDCAGPEPEGHRYPDTSKPKRTRARSEAEDGPNAAAPRKRGITKPPAPEKPAGRRAAKPVPAKGAKKSGKGRR